MSGKDAFVQALLQEGVTQGDITEHDDQGILLFPIDNTVTGVEIADLSNFPQEPPHWCHLSKEHHVADCFQPRQDPPILTGYNKYSLSPNGWGIPQNGEAVFSPIKAWKQAVRTRLYSAGE